MNDRFSNQPVQARAQTAPMPAGVAIDDGARRVLRNTWTLLSMALFFSAGVAALSMSQSWPHPGFLIFFFGGMGLIFLIQALRNSVWGLAGVFALAAWFGIGLGPVISHYLTSANGHSIVISAFGATGIGFIGLSIYAMTAKTDFGFLRPVIFAGILVAIAAMFIAYFFDLSGLWLALAAMVAPLMCALILYQTQQVVRGGERNYILATTTLFVAIYNLFTSLLHLFGFAFGDE